MDCTLQIFIGGRWVDCAQIDLHNGFCQWNYLVTYAVEHAHDPLSLAEPADLDIRAGRTLPAFLYDLVPARAGASCWANCSFRTPSIDAQVRQLQDL